MERSSVVERLSGLDAAFLCLDSVQAPMHLGAVAVFESGRRLRLAQLGEVLASRAARLAPLRRRVALGWLPPGAGIWVEDPAFDPDRHIRWHRVRRQRGETVATLAARLMTEPLDLRRPLWQLHVLTGLGGGRFALLVKLHHALADGLRAVELGLGLLDGFAELTATGARRSGPAPTPVRAPGPPDRLLDQFAATLPGVARQVADVAGIAASVLSDARAVVPTTPLLTRSPGGRQLALLRLDLAEIRRVRRRHGGTDNDVLLALFAGALRDWFARTGHRVDHANPRALIPVSRRARRDRRHRGNLLSGYLCELPVGEPDPLARLRHVRSVMDRNKAAGPSRGGGAIPLLADRMPAAVHRVTAPLVRHRAGLLFDVVVTNVPIPTLPLTLDGAVLRELYPIAPLPHGQALGVAVSTFRDSVHVGLHASGPGAADLELLADGLRRALAELAGTAVPSLDAVG